MFCCDSTRMRPSNPTPRFKTRAIVAGAAATAQRRGYCESKGAGGTLLTWVSQLQETTTMGHAIHPRFHGHATRGLTSRTRANKFSPQLARKSIAISRSILLCWCVRLHTAKLNTAKLNTAKLNTAEARALLNARRRLRLAGTLRRRAASRRKRPQTANERPTSEEREQRPRGGGLRAACTLHVLCRRRLHRTSRQPKRAPGCDPRGWWRHCCEGPAVDWCIVGGRGRGPPARQRLSEPPMQLKGEKLVPTTPCRRCWSSLL